MGEDWTPSRSWLAKAENDLSSAKVLASISHPILDTATYHCQQAGEKALKAVLAWKEKPLQKTHDLEILLNEVVGDCPGLEPLRESAEILTPYAVEYRYPADSATPARDEFEEALAAAVAIVNAVKRLIE
jgi:HEPN domain-containing protein